MLKILDYISDELYVFNTQHFLKNQDRFLDLSDLSDLIKTDKLASLNFLSHAIHARISTRHIFVSASSLTYVASPVPTLKTLI